MKLGSDTTLKILIFFKKNFIQIFIILIIFFCLIFTKSNKEADITCSSKSFENRQEKIENLINGEEKIAYLTFDDGPSKNITPKILDILKEENIKASFFVIGKKVKESPEIVRREYEEGHYIANHTYNHNNEILYKSIDNFKNEIINTDKAIGEAIGIEDYCSHIFRFPNGFMSPMYKEKKKICVKYLREVDYAYIDWNCLNNDSMKKYNDNQLMNNLKASAKNKKSLVILMHDTKDVSDSSLVLKESIDYLKQEGYIFKNFYDI